ncbi:MAG: spore coat associated protein CotJA [Oscillospiraceae bacterium]|nr:spore coat associated protein CotJA [Oscillospiraceae bacterium]
MESVRNNSQQSDCCSQFSSQPISLAMAYVAMQPWRNLYDIDVGLQRGTVFAELDLPFLGREGVPNDKQ